MSESAGADRDRGGDPARRSAAAVHRADADRPATPGWAHPSGGALADRVQQASAAAAGADSAGPSTRRQFGADPGGMAIRRAAASVGAADDPLERHADQVANAVVHRTAVPSPPSVPTAAPSVPTPPAVGDQGVHRAITELSEGDDVRRAATSTGGTQAVGREGGAVPEDVQSELDASRGGGRPLPPGVRTDFEQHLGIDLADVRLHTDPAADRFAARLGAVAFTRGRDIYFRSGRFDPESGSGRHLLAHELAHVQQGADGRMVHRRAVADPATVLRAGGATGGAPAKPQQQLRSLKLPAYKLDFLKSGPDPVPVTPGAREENGSKQVTKWREKVRSSVRAELDKKTGAAPVPPAPAADADTEDVEVLAANTGTPRYYFKLGKSDTFLFGSAAALATRLTRPDWTKTGAGESFDVDHQKELQLGGQDEADNLWLLRSSDNRSAGSAIKANRDAAVKELLDKETINRPGPGGSRIKGADELFAYYTVVVPQSALKPEGKGTPEHWAVLDMATAAVVQPLELLTGAKLAALMGKPGSFLLYSGITGGRRTSVKDGAALKAGGGTMKVTISKAEGNPASAGVDVGTISWTPPTGVEGESPGPQILKIKSLKDLERAGYVSTRDVKLKASLFSPVQWSTLEFDVHTGLLARGRVLPDRPPLNKNLDMGILVGSGGVGIYATISGGDLALPGPFKVVGGSLGLAYWPPKALTASGRIAFAVGSLATGWIGMKAGSGQEPFTIEGQLQFDTSMFTKADLGVTYRDGKWGFTGELAIGPGKVGGIRGASALVSYLDGKISATGTVEPELKGLRKGTLGVDYDIDTGALAITGVLGVAEFPGIKSGEIRARVSRTKSGAGWSLSGGITAQPSIPGVTGQITGTYEDGLFFAQADLGYQRGLLSGKLRVAATNQVVGADGKPSGAAGPNLLVFGRSDLTLQLTKWLTGTAGVELKPNGTIKLIGGIGLPPDFEIFGPLSKDQRLFSLGVTFPLFAGVIARIGGGIDLFGSIGPGKLLGTGITVEYDPDREDATTVKGQTKLVIPAAAGLRVVVEAGIGVGVPGVSATGNIVVGGELGVQGALEAAAALSWSRAAGVALDAEAQLWVSPLFRLTLGAKVLVEALGFEVYSKSWKFAQFDYGSALKFGVVAPIRFSGGVLDFNVDKIRFLYPPLDPAGLAKDVIGSKLTE